MANSLGMSSAELSGFERASQIAPKLVCKDFSGVPDYILVTRGRINYTSIMRLAQVQSTIKGQFGIGSKLVALRSRCVFGEFVLDRKDRLEILFDLAFDGALDDIAYKYHITRMETFDGKGSRSVNFLLN